MKKLSLLFTCLFFVLLTACNNEETSIDIDVKISPISDEEYRSVGATKDLIDPKQEDFKVLEYTFNMKHSKTVTNRKIENFVDWRTVLNSIDEIDRYWFGGGSTIDNASENYAEYQSKIVLYTKGLSEEDIKKAFSNETITVSWINHKKEVLKRDYNISDLIEFDSNN